MLSAKVGAEETSLDPLLDPLSGAENELSVSPALANACSISAIFLPVTKAISSNVLLKVSPSNDPNAFSSSLIARASVSMFSALIFVASARSFLAWI